MFVFYGNQNHWMDCNEFLHRSGPLRGRFLGVSTTYPCRYRSPKVVWGAFGGSAVCFGENVIKAKVAGHP